MLPLVLTISAIPAASPPWYGVAGRILTTPAVHIGLRPAVHIDRNEVAAAITLQLTALVL